MSRAMAVALTTVLILLSSIPLRAQQIGVYAGQQPDLNSWCNFPTPPPPPQSAQIAVIFSGDPNQFGGGEYKDVRFAVEFPPCFPYLVVGAGVLGHGSVPINQLANGFTVSLGSCRSDDVVVASISYLVFPGMQRPNTCCMIRVIPDPTAPSGMIEFTRCDDEKVYLFGGTVAGNIGTSFAGECGTLPAGTPPSNPYPADGATQVSMDTDVGFLAHWPSMGLGCFLLFGEDLQIFFGTNPNPPQIPTVDWLDERFGFDPGSLQPATTYYWRVRYTNTLGGLTPIDSPIWSFTTEQPLATEKKTWGAVKAMYR